MRAEATRRRFLTETTALASLLGAGMSTVARAESAVRKGPKRVTLAKPGPMLPPVPAILLTVKGRPGEPDEISVLWTFVVSGDPPQVGVSAGDEHRASSLLALHRQFVLNVPVASLVHPFDVVDMSSSRVADKFVLAGLTRGTAATVDAPTVEEAPIQLECRVSQVLRVPPARTVFLADVVATSVHEGICDEGGRLVVSSAPFYGMTSGSGEFYTLGQKVGHIGQSVGRSDIRY